MGTGVPFIRREHSAAKGRCQPTGGPSVHPQTIFFRRVLPMSVTSPGNPPRRAHDASLRQAGAE